MEALIVPFLALTLIGGIVVKGIRAKQRRRRWLLEEVGDGLRDPVSDGERVVGSLGDRTVALALIRRGSGKSSSSWTEVQVQARGGDLELSIRPQSVLDAPLVAAGLTIDIVTGDKRFDWVFLVEGAPTDLVRWFCNDTVRRELLSWMPCELKVDATGVMLARSGHFREADEARRFLDSACEISDQLAAALAAAERAAQQGISDPSSTPAQSAPYREGGAALVRLDEKRRRDLERLDAVRARRALANKVAGIALAVVGMAYWLRGCCRL